MSKRYPIEPLLLDAIKNGRSILCVSHIAPDGDAVGSLLGMGWLLQALGKQPVLSLQDETPVEHRVLPGASSVITAKSAQFESSVRQQAFDTIICLDASSPDRMGSVYNPSIHASARLVVIDHHITNTRFGDVDWVEPSSAATCQMLVYLADALQVPLVGEIAECLLTGVVTDTLAFRTSNTTVDVLDVAMRLMRGGADLSTITQRTVNRRPFSMVRLWGQVLPHVQLEDGVVWTSVGSQDLEEAGDGNQDLNLSSFLVTADEADISAVFTEKLDSRNGDPIPAVECSFRAKPGFDVAQVAFSFGGGGHPSASGCTVAGTLPEVMAQVIPALKRARSARAHSGV